MIHDPVGVPGSVLIAQDAIETEYPTLHAEATRAFTDPNFFREVKYGAGKQVLPQLSTQGFIEYVELLVHVDENYDLIEDMDLHNYLMILGLFGILSPRHLAGVTDISENALRKNIRRPDGQDCRLGGALDIANIKNVIGALKEEETKGVINFAILKSVRDCGTSITLLSWMTGVTAQTLARNFRPKNERKSVARTDSPRSTKPRAEGHPAPSIAKPPAGYEDPITGPDDPRLKLTQPLYSWNVSRGEAQLTYWGYKAGLGDQQKLAGAAGRDDLAEKPVRPRRKAVQWQAGAAAKR